MIFPFPENLKKPQFAPATWMLVGLNLFIFLVFFAGPEKDTGTKIYTERGLVTAGRLYRQFLDSLPPEERMKNPAWMGELHDETGEGIQFLGAVGLRDARFGEFLKHPELLHGDPVEVESFQADFAKHRQDVSSTALWKFGLNSQSSLLTWITYQFSHAGAFHLLSNLVYLIILGFAIEAAVGGFALFALYLCGGIAGGLFFIAANPTGIVPMVGASGAVSALLGFYCFFEARRRIRYFYFILPVAGQNGFIYMPTLLLIPMFLVSDLASLLSSPEGMGSGVAYACHIGGAVFGALLAVTMRYAFRFPQRARD